MDGCLFCLCAYNISVDEEKMPISNRFVNVEQTVINLFGKVYQIYSSEPFAICQALPSSASAS
jgi:hypothetical protein